MNLKNKIFFDSDVSIKSIIGKKIGVIGYGNQGRAQALNLRDSGVDVRIGLRNDSLNKDKVLEDNLRYLNINNLIRESDIISIMIPDNHIKGLITDKVSILKEGHTLLLSHGSSIIYDKIDIPNYVNVVMVAPSGGGRVVREQYKKGFGVPALIAIHNDYTKDSLDITLAYAKAIGSTRAAVFISTFKEETETDLFGEQISLTGSIPMILIESYKVLLEYGYSPIVAWFVCFYELKTITDLMFEKGMTSFYDMVSDTARYGGISRGKMLIDNRFKDKMRKILDEIRDGTFNKELKEALLNDDLKNLDNVFDSKEFNEIEEKLLSKIKNIN